MLQSNSTGEDVPNEEESFLVFLSVLFLFVLFPLILLFLWKKGNRTGFGFGDFRTIQPPYVPPVVYEQVVSYEQSNVQQMMETFRTDKANDVAEVLNGIANEDVKLLSNGVTKATIPLRFLHSNDPRAYNAAFKAWQTDFFAICRKLDASQVSAAMVRFAEQELQELRETQLKDFHFSGEFGDLVINQLGLKNNLDEWGVSNSKYANFWLYVDQCVRDTFITRALVRPLKFESIARIGFATSDDFYDWGHLGFSWAIFLGTLLISISPTLSNQKETAPFAVAAIVAGSAFLAHNSSTKKEDEKKIAAPPPASDMPKSA